MFSKGIGVKKDLKEAIKWYEKAAFNHEWEDIEAQQYAILNLQKLKTS